MATHGTDRDRDRWLPVRGRATDAQRLAGGLGWFSIGLGVAGLAAPRLLARLIGAPDRGKTPAVLFNGRKRLVDRSSTTVTTFVKLLTAVTL